MPRLHRRGNQMKNQKDFRKLLNKMYKEMDDVGEKRIINLQNQLRKDLNKIRKKYERLLKFKEKKNED